MSQVSQRDKAEVKAKRHGTWKGTHRAQRKHRVSVIRHRHRAARRVGKMIVQKELEMTKIKLTEGEYDAERAAQFWVSSTGVGLVFREKESLVDSLKVAYEAGIRESSEKAEAKIDALRGAVLAVQAVEDVWVSRHIANAAPGDCDTCDLMNDLNAALAVAPTEVEMSEESVTEDFVNSFGTRKDFVGVAARLIACGNLPEGVNFNDKRVLLIEMLCMAGDTLPKCMTCSGEGYFSIGMTVDACADCFGTGIQNPVDR